MARAGGPDAQGAGGMRFGRAAGLWVAQEVSNPSTGYRPHLGSWDAVARALDQAGTKGAGPAESNVAA
ncbi:hypothetical protein [Streptomyces sp. N50]|uniref:hypothetical protein n=1 Tax=Streptomyces sp. N50 TaxID=3081765 RepID=UPI002961E904|nr:hypothetical protein [Streptomyces sp. N50]WOX07817.1 hypothetical protein R2B38_02565 [Streptomyces sp. N50]